MDSIKRNKRKSIVCWVIAFALAIFYLVVSCLPFIFMVLNSFKEKFEMLTKGVFSLPDTFYVQNYKEVLTGGFFTYFINSVLNPWSLIIISCCNHFVYAVCRYV